CTPVIHENGNESYKDSWRIKFRQSPWMKEYIKENICKRKIAKATGDEFGVMYYKLKNNAVFGKQMENVCKHMRVELLQTDEDKKIRRLVSSPLFVGFNQFERGVYSHSNAKKYNDSKQTYRCRARDLDISKAMDV